MGCSLQNRISTTTGSEMAVHGAACVFSGYLSGRGRRRCGLVGSWSAWTLLFGAVSIQSDVILKNDILFCKLSCFFFGDSFEVSPEVIV
jgi:hypothetical protein